MRGSCGRVQRSVSSASRSSSSASSISWSGPTRGSGRPAWWAGCCSSPGRSPSRSQLLALRRRRNLLTNLQFAFDERGIQSVGIASEADVRWAGIDRITRSGPYLFVRFATGGTLLVPVAAFRPEQLDAFGRIALRNGLTLDGHRVDVPAR